MESKKVALITGASSGIGEAMARLLAEESYDLILVARNEERLNELAEEIADKSGASAWALVSDLSDPKSPSEIFDAVTGWGMDVDLLVNNAGYGAYGKFTEIESSNNIDMIQVMISSLTELTNRFLPFMQKRGSGGVINVGSTGSLVPCPNMAVYGAIKSYVASFSEALSEELRGTGVTATALLPGNTRTGFSQRAGTEKTRVARLLPMSAESVARIGYRAYLNGRPRVIAGCFNAIQMGMVPFMPRFIVNRLTRFYLAA